MTSLYEKEKDLNKQLLSESLDSSQGEIDAEENKDTDDEAEDNEFAFSDKDDVDVAPTAGNAKAPKKSVVQTEQIFRKKYESEQELNITLQEELRGIK